MKKLQFSPKQRQVLDWWREDRFDAVICDGAVRSGKTFALSVSFFLWAMAGFHRQRFGTSTNNLIVKCHHDALRTRCDRFTSFEHRSLSHR